MNADAVVTAAKERIHMQMAYSSVQRSMRISVIIPHLNQPVMLERCLASLVAGRRQPDEIIVVDNGSQNLPAAICDSFSNVMLLQEELPGPGPARNRGIDHATGDILAFIDADCLADPNWLDTAASVMLDPKATVLGGDVRIAYVDPSRLTILEAYESIYAYRMDRYIAREGFTGTGNLIARAQVVKDVGPFAGIGVAEDRDWGHRATAKGYRIRYVAEMTVYHPARTHAGELRQKWDRHMAHDFILARKTPIGLLKWTVKALVMGASPLVEVPRILLSTRVTGVRSRFLAFLGLSRIRIYRSIKMVWLLFGGSPERLTGRWNRQVGS